MTYRTNDVEKTRQMRAKRRDDHLDVVPVALTGVGAALCIMASCLDVSHAIVAGDAFPLLVFSAGMMALGAGVYGMVREWA